MEARSADAGERAASRLVRFAGGNGTPVYRHDGRRLGTIDWLALDPDSGRIALVTLSSRRFGLFARKQATLPWSAFSLDETSGRLTLRGKRPAEETVAQGSARVVRRDPARAE